LANNLGNLHAWQGKVEEATSDFERAVALKAKALGADHPDVGDSSHNLSVVLRMRGRLSEALAASDRGAIGLRWESEIPGSDFHFANRSAIFRRLGRFAEAQSAADIVLSRREKWPRGYQSDILGELACIKVARSSPAEAIAYLEEVLRAQARNPVLPALHAETQFRLAVALAKVNHRSVRAVSLARTALATYSALPQFARDRREVDTWLTSR
jgi:tetratricopeptide (TPR) repeat protein